MKTKVLIISILTLLLYSCDKGSPEPNPDQTLEEEVFIRVNAYRQEMDLPIFTACEACADEARDHSLDMSKGKVEFGHDGSDVRFQTLVDGIGAASFAENVARGYPTAEQVVQGWIDSDGHRKNIEGNYTHMGIGIAESRDGEKFYTQIFVRIP